jgi:O-antigen/teichoic acid export membrane protein
MVYGLGEVAVKLFSLITVPVYTRLFDPAEYGTLSIVLTLNGLFMAVVILGGDSAYARFFFAARTRDEQQQVTSTWIGFLAAWSLFAALVVLPFAPQIAAWALGGDANVLLIAVPLLSVPIVVVNRMCAQVLRNEFRAAAFTWLNIASVALSIGVGLVAAVGLGLGLLGILVGALGAEALLLPIRLWVARGMFRATFSRQVLRRLLAFGVPLVPISLAYWVFLVSDRLLLGRLSSLEQAGLYSVAASLVGVTSVAVAALGQAWTPHAVRLFEDEPHRAPSLFGRMLTYVLAGFGFLCIGISTLAPELLDILTGAGFEAAAVAVPPLALGMVAYASTHVTAAGITLRLRTQYLAIHAWLAAAVNLALNLVLIPGFGMLGAAWATMVAYSVLTVAYLVTSQRLWPVRYESRRSITIVAVIVAMTAGGVLIPELPVVTSIVVKVAYCALFPIALFALRAFDQRERQALAAVVRVIRR